MIRSLLIALLTLLPASRLLTWGGPASANPAGGIYDVAQRVVLSGSDRTIFFTTDGSLPSPKHGLRYTEPLLLSNSTVLRFTAPDRDGSGTVVTCTYIFPASVVQQDGSGFPSNWGFTNGAPVAAYYKMAPEILSAPAHRDLIVRSLKAIPSISLVVAPEDLFGSDRGIYAQPQESGVEWERAASLELIDPGAAGQLQVNCGVRIQGGWNRRPEESPKHAFRLLFKKKYGSGKLHYPLLGKEGPEEFDELILRAGCNNSWLHWSGIERRRAEFIRDQWMRDTLREMGQPSAAGRFVHLYLNGLYWGVYNLAERPDEAFAAAHLGGSRKEYDSFNADNTLQGDREAWRELMRRVNRGVRGHDDFQAVSGLLNIENFADYMILNFYGANADWDRHSNWYAARRRNPPGRFQFFIWDAERTLEEVNDDRIDFDDDESPPRIFHRLAENAEFRAAFSERVRRHFFGNGALTPRAAGERYRRLSEQIDLAIVAESGRWGAYRKTFHPYKEGPYEIYTRDGHWRPEVNRLLTEYFPRRSEIVLEQFRRRGLWTAPR